MQRAQSNIEAATKACETQARACAGNIGEACTLGPSHIQRTSGSGTNPHASVPTFLTERQSDMHAPQHCIYLKTQAHARQELSDLSDVLHMSHTWIFTTSYHLVHLRQAHTGSHRLTQAHLISVSCYMSRSTDLVVSTLLRPCSTSRIQSRRFRPLTRNHFAHHDNKPFTISGNGQQWLSRSLLRQHLC